MLSHLRCRLAVLLLACAVATPAARAEPAARLDAAREAAVVQARGGDVAGGRARLEALFAEYPQALGVRLDLAVVAGWAGADSRTTQLLEGLDPTSLPDYVLESYAKALRNLKQWERALELYDLLVTRDPARLEPALARVLVLADADRFEAARAALQPLLSQPAAAAGAAPSTGMADARYACGYVEERARRLTQALACYRAALRLDPDHADARRRYAITASALGANAQARALAAANPGLLDPPTLERLELDQAAMQVRWAGLPDGDGRAPARAAVAAQQTLLTRPGLTGTETPRGRALQFDHVAALAAAGDMAAAVEAFEALAVPPADMPVYVLAAAADAYLYLDRPARAVPLFDIAASKAPERFELQRGLFYARSDLQDHAGADAVVRRLEDREPAWHHPRAGAWVPNPDYGEVRELAALSLAFKDRYAESLQAFDHQLALAPANGATRLSRAQVRRWRGWYAAAAEDVARVRALTPDHHAAGLLDGHLALDTHRFERARHRLTEAVRDAPLAKGTLALARRWRVHDSPELQVEAGVGRSDGGAFSSRDWRLDGYYFSAPLHHRYRAFVHDSASYGRFDEGPGRDHRLGAGVEYRRPAWTLRGEVYQGLEDNQGTGAAVDGEWRLDDHLALRAGAAANSRNVPLRGTRVGVEGSEFELGGRYRWHEARELAVRTTLMDLNDDNRRESLQAAYRDRLLNRPRHKLLTSLRAYASRNSEPDRAYYNPASDRELTAGLSYEWRLLRNHERSLTQRLGIEAGDYWQEDFGSGTVWTLSAEHDWQLGARTALRYGISTGGRVYDGNREHMAALYLGVTWRP